VNPFPPYPRYKLLTTTAMAHAVVASTAVVPDIDDDAQSSKSFESVKPFDRAKVKPGPGALPPSAFDPLRHVDYAAFWHEIEKRFHPINTADLGFLRNIPVNPYGAQYDSALRLPVPADAPMLQRPIHPPQSIHQPAAFGPSSSRVAPRPSSAAPAVDLSSVPVDESALNSYPLTQRLVAALLDEGGGGQPSAAPQRPARGMTSEVDRFWPGIGAEPELRAYQRALEGRVATELREAGLISQKAIGDEVEVAMREEQWRLRDVKTANRARKSSLYTLIVGTELRRQAFKREEKKHHDKAEVVFLERMVKKCKVTKKSRSKYPKLLAKMQKLYSEQKQVAPTTATLSVVAAPPASAGATSNAANAGYVSGTAPTVGIVSAGGAAAAVGAASTAAAQAGAVVVMTGGPPTDSRSKKKRRKSDTKRPGVAAKSAASKGKPPRVLE
jgi:Histone acetyltransferases subunit 3